MYVYAFQVMVFTMSMLIFKDKEICKMSAKNTCALRLGGGGLINSPVSDNLCSLDIGTEYVSWALMILFRRFYSFKLHTMVQTVLNRLIVLSFLVTWVVIQNSCGVQWHQCSNNLKSVSDVEYGYVEIILGYKH